MCVCGSGSIESQYLLSPSFSLAQLSDVLCERGAGQVMGVQNS